MTTLSENNLMHEDGNNQSPFPIMQDTTLGFMMNLVDEEAHNNQAWR